MYSASLNLACICSKMVWLELSAKLIVPFSTSHLSWMQISGNLALNLTAIKQSLAPVSINAWRGGLASGLTQILALGNAKIYQHVGIYNAKFCRRGHCPTPTPDARYFALQWNLGFSVHFIKKLNLTKQLCHLVHVWQVRSPYIVRFCARTCWLVSLLLFPIIRSGLAPHSHTQPVKTGRFLLLVH